MHNILIMVLVVFSTSVNASEETMNFFEFVPGTKYQKDIPERDMKSFLPYAYLTHYQPAENLLLMSSSYKVNVNKNTKNISHVSIELPTNGVRDCMLQKERVLQVLQDKGFKKAKPIDGFFSRAAIKGPLVAELDCSTPVVQPGSSQSPSTELRLSITTAKEHDMFEAAMRNLSR